MGTLNDLITLTKSEENYVEKASNSNLDSKTANKGTKNYTKYSSDVNNAGLMGCQGQPWCATFQFWLEMKTFGKEQALKNWNMTSKTYCGYNCFATYNKFKAAGKVGMTPKLGALVIFTYSHMGRVIDIYTRNGIKYYFCAEGNTSSNLNDRNGGQVKIKERQFYDTSTIKGYCYIDYDVVTAVYNQVQNMKETAQLCGICPESVSKILKINNIKTKSSAEIIKEKASIPVNMFSLDGEYIKTFASTADAARFLMNRNCVNCKFTTIRYHISEVAKGKRKTAYGYKWRFLHS